MSRARTAGPPPAASSSAFSASRSLASPAASSAATSPKTPASPRPRAHWEPPHGAASREARRAELEESPRRSVGSQTPLYEYPEVRELWCADPLDRSLSLEDRERPLEPRSFLATISKNVFLTRICTSIRSTAFHAPPLTHLKGAGGSAGGWTGADTETSGGRGKGRPLLTIPQN